MISDLRSLAIDLIYQVFPSDVTIRRSDADENGYIESLFIISGEYTVEEFVKWESRWTELWVDLTDDKYSDCRHHVGIMCWPRNPGELDNA